MIIQHYSRSEKLLTKCLYFFEKYTPNAAYCIYMLFGYIYAQDRLLYLYAFWLHIRPARLDLASLEDLLSSAPLTFAILPAAGAAAFLVFLHDFHAKY